MRERRLKLVTVLEKELLAILNWHLSPEGSFLKLRHRDIPEDAIIERVFGDQQRYRLMATVSHPSFDVVPDNEIPPLIGPDDGSIVLIKMEDVPEPERFVTADFDQQVAAVMGNEHLRNRIYRLVELAQEELAREEQTSEATPATELQS